ncbi:7494_t:CDS:2, partial [Ambispora gerdemannii]
EKDETEAETEKEIENDLSIKKPASINTILKNSFVSPTDIPWTGDEPIQSTVVRMIEDKYPPLKVKRDSVKEFIDARINKNALSSLSDFNDQRFKNENDSSAVIIAIAATNDEMSSKSSSPKKTSLTPEQKKIKQREAKQSRIVDAREAAAEYSISKKYPTGDNDDHSSFTTTRFVSKSITQWESLVEQRIQEAMAAGEFKNLPYRGKPLPVDKNEMNPYIHRTEFLMNRLVQRQGAAPAWIEMQKEVDSEIRLFRKNLQTNWKRHVIAHHLFDKRDRNWEQAQKSYLEEALQKLNSRLRSYNIVAPFAARRSYLTID